MKISMLKTIFAVTTISLAAVTTAQANTFADSSDPTPMMSSHPATNQDVTDATNNYFDSKLASATALADVAETNYQQTDILSLDSTAQNHSLSMLLAGLSMMTFVVMRRRIRL